MGNNYDTYRILITKSQEDFFSDIIIPIKHYIVIRRLFNGDEQYNYDSQRIFYSHNAMS